MASIAQAAERETDDILAEYLRVINKKDTEIQRLLADKERLETDSKKREEKYKVKLRDLKAQVEALQHSNSTSHRVRSVEHAEYERLSNENQQLVADITTLRTAFQKQEDQMKSILKANAKAQKHESHAREKLESQYAESHTKVQRDLQDARHRIGTLEADLLAAQKRCQSTDGDTTRWKVEAQKLQQEAKENQAVIKELKRRSKGLVPKDSVDVELARSEGHHRSLISGMERELTRLRHELQEETARCGKLEVQLVEYRHRAEELHRERENLVSNTHEMDVTLATERLENARATEELKNDMAREIANNRDTIEALEKDRIALNSEVVRLQARVTDAEGTLNSTQTRFQADESALTSENVRLKQDLALARNDAENQRRVVQQQEDFIKTLQSKNETQREESISEAYRVKSEIEHFDTLVRKHEANNNLLEKVAQDTKDQLKETQHELNEERDQFLAKEQEWRREILTLEAEVRAKEEDKRLALARLEDKVRMLEADHQSILSQKDRDFKQKSIAMNALNKETEDKLTMSDAKVAELNALSEKLRAQLQGELDKNRASTEQIRDSDSRLTSLEMQLSERDAAIATLRRTAESNSAAHLSTQDMLATAQGELDHQTSRREEAESKLSAANTQLRTRDEEVRDLQGSLQRITTASQHHEQEVGEQMNQMKDRVHQLVSELHSAEQKVAMQRLEISRLESKHADECEALRRDVYNPLQEKVESLVSINNKLHRDLHEKEERLVELAALERKVSSQQDGALSLQAELADRERKISRLDAEVMELRRHQRDASSDRDLVARQKADIESLLRKVASLEGMVESSTKEAAELRNRETNLLSDVAGKRSESSALAERVANLESLKAIHDTQMAEQKALVQRLRDELEDSRNAQNMMQACFDKQQQQLNYDRQLRGQAGWNASAQSPNMMLPGQR